MSLLAYFDCSNGISGDMTLGALLDAGVDLKDLRKELKRLPVCGWRLEAQEVRRVGVAGTLATVALSKSAAQPHRRYSDIRSMLEGVALPGRAGERALRAFLLLGRAEAAVHRIPLGKVHFHEVGAVDAIIDIVGSMVGLEMLGAEGSKIPSAVEGFAASTVVVGSGEVQCGHGTLPVPAPATARLLEGAPVEAGPVAREMTTPTGAAILRALDPQFGPLPPVRLTKTAYGAGQREIPGRTNYLRLLLGEPLDSARGAGALRSDRLFVLTTEIDDMNPEHYGPALERLFRAGCRDAFLTPILMKKGRPGVSICVLTDEEKRGEMLEILLRHTTTFGVKSIAVERHCLPRKRAAVATPYGMVHVKIGWWGDEVLKASPEYEDCRRLAEKANVPVGLVYQSALDAVAHSPEVDFSRP
ncbi:MAG: nickel pincer cofactor biosynthesis protein LarC [Candidatus Sumerlaeota bacterium]|nr:nickel pincer cofactor biosynthesis protein LarC [Candidatus Sumerlaeota bacterium]